MAERQLTIAQHHDEVWRRLQDVTTWEGIGGMRRLREARHAADGTLERFAYSLDTPIGTIDDDADVITLDRADGRTMRATTETKGIRVSVELTVSAGTAADTTDARFVIDADATSFLTKPLAGTLRHTLDNGIERESDRMVQRLETP